MSLTQLKERVNRAIEDCQDEIIGLTKKLVQTPSENKPPQGDELACQKVIHEFFKRERIKTEFIYLLNSLK